MARQHSAAYTAYLESDQWRLLRAEVIRRAGHRCESCGRGGALDVHHAYGYRNLGNEQPEELQALCRGCHDGVHRAASTTGAGCLRTLFWIVAIAIGLEVGWWLLATVLRHFGVF